MYITDIMLCTKCVKRNSNNVSYTLDLYLYSQYPSNRLDTRFDIPHQCSCTVIVLYSVCLHTTVNSWVRN